MTTILSIDPGYSTTGIAISIDGTPLCWEILKLSSKDDLATRRKIVVNRIAELRSGIDLLVIERLWGPFGVSISTSIIDYAHEANLPIKSLNPRTWKRTLLGDSDAPKAKSVEYAQAWTGDENLTDDNGADAVCISICAHRHPELLKAAEGREKSMKSVKGKPKRLPLKV